MSGRQGQNLFAFYTAHQSAAGYSEAKFATTPTDGIEGNFKVYRSPTAGFYRAEITYLGNTNYIAWSGHNPNTVDYSGGLEATCNTSRIDRTYINTNKYRDKNSGVYTTINNGVKVDLASDGTIDWCAQPVTFRYRLHSSLVDGCL
jgi:hypothetical protein